MRWVLPLLFLISDLLPRAMAAGVSFPAATRPSYASGLTLYQQHCAPCHGADFFQERWREAHSPSDITGAALGVEEHPSIPLDPLAAWHVTAYVWSAQLSPEMYRLGEALVLEAESQLQRSGLLLLVTRGKGLREHGSQAPAYPLMLRDLPIVPWHCPFEEAFALMREHSVPALSIVDRKGRLVGLVTPENVGEMMMVQTALQERPPQPVGGSQCFGRRAVA